MSKMIQIRNVPDAVHRKIKARAAQSGMTLARLHARARVKLRTLAAEIIRTERESA